MTFREIQKAVYSNKLVKGFNIENIHQEFNFIYGEVSEAFDAWYKKLPTLGEELADIVIFVLGLSEILGIDLQSEIERKIKINTGRKIIIKNGVPLKESDVTSM